MKRVAALDGLRGIAILLVLAWHYVRLSIEPPPSGPWLPIVRLLDLSWSGVDLFFVLSGFLLGTILLENRASPTLFRVFYLRRACRILPLYYAWLLVAAIVIGLHLERAWVGFHYVFGEPNPLWTHATFTQNFAMIASGKFGSPWLGITWSLAVEEQFYLFLPLLVRFTPEARLPVVLLALILVAPITRSIAGDFLPRYVLMPARLDALLGGVAVAWALRRPGFVAFVARERRAAHVVLAILAIGVGAIAYAGLNLETAATRALTWLAALYAALVVEVVANPTGLLHATCSARPLRWIGRISYGVYVFHQGVQWLVFGVVRGETPGIADAGGAAVALLALAITLGLAAASYRWFESPFLRLAHRRDYAPARAIARAVS